MTIRDHIIQWAREREPVSVNEIAEHVQLLFARQADAAKQGMNAAKKHGAHMEAEAKRLHAECSPEALESERAANARLTEELEALRREIGPNDETFLYQRDEARQERDALAAHVEELHTLLSGALLGLRWFRDMHPDQDTENDAEFDTHISEALKRSPATSLARRDAEQQAEALERVERQLPIKSALTKTLIRQEIDRLRHQVEGDET